MKMGVKDTLKVTVDDMITYELLSQDPLISL